MKLTVKKSILTNAILISVGFFVLGVITLPHYGINWDTINHAPRGQSYLYYFLTGERDFSSLPQMFSEWEKPGQWYWQKPESLFIDTDIPENALTRVSLYQKAGVDFNYFAENDVGHPPLSDILSSAFNVLLFQKLGLIIDIDSYRVYSVLLAAALVGLLFYWVSGVYGKFSGLVAAIALSLYPLFWSESHFNTEKDIPHTVFWSFLLFATWKGITNKSWKWILASGVFGGLALGTKFNIVFVPFVIVPWFMYFALLQGWFLKPLQFARENKGFLLSICAVPVLALAILVGTWPYLWADPAGRLANIVGFYKGIGTTSSVNTAFLGPLGTNTYPIQWIIYATPLAILALAVVGVIAAFFRLRAERDKISLLFLLWLVIPIARVTWPGMTIYGGIRQIVEYMPATAILAGLGGLVIRDWLAKGIPDLDIRFNKKVIAGVLVLTAFAPITVKLINIHPNENVYFNPLIGGLAGARERNFPTWGNSFGAAYRQGAVWLNDNAEENAKVAYARELIPNIPRIWLRRDMELHNGNRSGHLKNSEYVIALTYEGTINTSYFDRYLERFLMPVYEAQVDGVSILKVWKNDKEHTKADYLNERELRDFKVSRTGSGLRFELGNNVNLLSIKGEFEESGCSPLESAYVRISIDGLNWQRLPGTMPNEDWSVPQFGNQPKNGKVFIAFAADEASHVDLIIGPADSCLVNLENIEVSVVDLPE